MPAIPAQRPWTAQRSPSTKRTAHRPRRGEHDGADLVERRPRHREEADTWQHGAFTKALLDAFNDPAADINHNGLISTTGLANYLDEARAGADGRAADAGHGGPVRYDGVCKRGVGDHGRPASVLTTGRNVDAKRVGHELGVRYMLDGSVRKRGNWGAHHGIAAYRRYSAPPIRRCGGVELSAASLEYTQPKTCVFQFPRNSV